MVVFCYFHLVSAHRRAYEEPFCVNMHKVMFLFHFALHYIYIWPFKLQKCSFICLLPSSLTMDCNPAADVQ